MKPNKGQTCRSCTAVWDGNVYVYLDGSAHVFGNCIYHYSPQVNQKNNGYMDSMKQTLPLDTIKSNKVDINFRNSKKMDNKLKIISPEEINNINWRLLNFVKNTQN